MLQPGDFDFVEAGARMLCEGGELYYLVAGHLGLMSMADPLRSFLGHDDSEGNAGEGGVTVTGAQRDALERLSDPMRLMRLFAVANETGGEDEVRGYLRGMEGHLSAVASNESTLVQVALDLDASLDVAGQILPVAALAGGGASATALELRPTAPIEVPPTPSPAPVSDAAPAVVALPPSTSPAPEDTVPLPAGPSAVPLPSAPSDAAPAPEPVIADLDDRRKNEAAADAFAGAFGSMMAPEPAPEPVNEPEPEPVTDEERFLAADEDESGGLSIEELAEATGTDLEEAARLHAAADVDGDGQVTLEEFVGSQAAEVASALPRPVRAAPVRAPVGQQPNPVRPRNLRPCLNPGPCSRRRLLAGMASATTQHLGRATTAQCLGPNAATRVGSAATPGLGSAPQCTTCLQPSPLACVAQGVVSASTVSGVSVRCAGRGILPCRTDHSSTKAPFSSRSSSSNQTDGACMTPRG